MAGVTIGSFRHAMCRTERHASQVRIIEEQADQLGVELLAPWREIRAAAILEPGAIRRRFGLPPSVAASLAAAAVPNRPSMGILGIFDRK